MPSESLGIRLTEEEFYRFEQYLELLRKRALDDEFPQPIRKNTVAKWLLLKALKQELRGGKQR